MFIKFNEILIDVSNCYFKPTKLTANPLLQIAEKDSYAIHLFPVESDFGQSQHITGEYFDTAEERDKRFAELESQLMGNLDMNYIRHILKEYKMKLVKDQKYEDGAKIREIEKIIEKL